MPDLFETQNFNVVQIEGKFRTDLGEMTGQELYAFIGTKAGLDHANQLEAELAQKETITVPYKSAFGSDSIYEIQRKP